MPEASAPMLPQSALTQAAAAAAAAMPYFLQGGDLAEANGGANANAAYQMQLPLSPSLMRNLGDRSYDKRKSAAMELENLIKQLQENAAAIEFRQQHANQGGGASSPDTASGVSGDSTDSTATPGFSVPNPSRQRIPAIIELLGNDFACSANANHRKGGLIGLAATAIGLMHDAHMYLDKLLPPVLHCFDDPESRVRYYACESLYNIAKVARGHILQYFNQIFDGLCKVRVAVFGSNCCFVQLTSVYFGYAAVCRCGCGREERRELAGSPCQRYRHGERVL